MQQYPPNGQPGLQGGQQGYPGMYAPAPPGFFGTAMQGQSFSGNGIQQQQAYNQQAGAMLGGAAVSTIAGTGTAALTAAGVIGMAAPMLHAGLKGGGAGSRAMSMGVTAIDQLDPTTHMFKTMKWGGKAGKFAGGAFGKLLGAGAKRMGVSALTSGVGASAIGGMGMLAGGLMGGIAPLAASAAIYSAVEYGGKQMYSGAQRSIQGTGLMNSIGASNGIQDMKGMGGGEETGRMMQGLAGDMGTSMDDIGRYAKTLDSQKMFQTTRSAKEFRSKFKEVMKAVKEISKMTQGTIDDAVKTFSDLRSQGFYTTADIKAQAATRQAREATTGISTGMQSAIGQAGGQMAQQYGMRRKYGSQMAESSVASVSRGVRSGAMSEEAVLEMGGVERVGLDISRKKMSFLQSSRGRAMIAYSMGKGGAPDADRLGKLLSGTSMEDIVSTASGRGLGILRASGTKEAREKFSKYSGMAMLSMAASQQKQLYGKVTEKGIIGMMGTMGVNKEQSKIMMQEALGMKKQMKDEAASKASVASKAEYDSTRTAAKWTTRLSGALDSSIGSPMRTLGASIYQGVSSDYTHDMDTLYGSRTYKTSGDEANGLRRLRELRKKGGGSVRLSGGKESGSWLGLKTARSRIEGQYGEMVQSGNVGGDRMDLGGGKSIGRDDLRAADNAVREGKKSKISKEEMTNLTYAFGRGDFQDNMRAGTMSDILGYDPKHNRSKERVLSEKYKGANLWDEHKSYSIAKGMGRVSGSFDEYMATGKTERLKMSEITRRAAIQAGSSIGGADGASLKALAGSSRDSGLGSASDLQGMRDSFEDSMSGALMKSHGRDGLGLNRTNKKLARKLNEDPASRRAYKEYMSAISQVKDRKNKTPEEKARIVKAKGRLSALLGPDSAEFQHVKDMDSRMDRDPSLANSMKKSWSKDGDMTNAIDDRSAVDVRASEIADIKAGVGGMDMSKVGDVKMRDSLTTLGRAVGTDGHDVAVAGVIDTALSDGKLDANERRQLNKASNGRAGSLISGIDSITSGKAELSDAMTSAGITADDLKAAKGDAKAAGALLQKLGVKDFSGDKDSATSGGSTMQGVQEKYMERATTFISLVDKTVIALQKAGIKIGDGSSVNGDKSTLDFTKEFLFGQ